MAAENPGGETPEPPDREEYEKTAAVFEARKRHDRCDDVSVTGSTVDGEEVLYCTNCRQVLLRWGGE